MFIIKFELFLLLFIFFKNYNKVKNLQHKLNSHEALRFLKLIVFHQQPSILKLTILVRPHGPIYLLSSNVIEKHCGNGHHNFIYQSPLSLSFLLYLSSLLQEGVHHHDPSSHCSYHLNSHNSLAHPLELGSQSSTLNFGALMQISKLQNFEL